MNENPYQSPQSVEPGHASGSGAWWRGAAVFLAGFAWTALLGYCAGGGRYWRALLAYSALIGAVAAGAYLRRASRRR